MNNIAIILLVSLGLSLLSCGPSKKFMEEKNSDIPVREIIHAVLEYKYKGIKENLDVEGRELNKKNKTPQIDQEIKYEKYLIEHIEILEKGGVWEDYPTLTYDTSMVVNLGSYAYTTEGGATVYFKKLSEMSGNGYLSFTPPSWDEEKKRFCGFMKLTYGEVHIYAVKKVNGKFICEYTVFYHS